MIYVIKIYSEYDNLNCLIFQWNKTLKNVKNCLNTNIYSYLETSGGKSSNLCLDVVNFFNDSVNKTAVAA